MSENKKIGYLLIIKATLFFVISSILAIFIFAFVMYLLEGGYEYSPIYATVSVAFGGFVASFYLGLKLQKNGILIGLSVGGIIFLVVTLLALIINSGAVSIHLLLRLIILILSSVIGGILGVNRKSEPKYI
jgi:putative membrane protein (TIGR04086 family)